MSKLTKTLASVTKKLKWPENNSIGYQTLDRSHKFLNPPPLTPPPPPLPSGRSLRLGQDFIYPQRLGFWQSLAYDYTSPVADKYYAYRFLSTASANQQDHSSKNPQKMEQWQQLAHDQPAGSANSWSPAGGGGGGSAGAQVPLDVVVAVNGSTTEPRYYYIHETLTILTFSVVLCLWFYVYGADRDKSAGGQAAAGGSNTSRRGSTDSADWGPHQKTFINDLEMRLYNMLPLRATSSLWGKINSYDLPIWMRSRLYDFFCRTYDCDMSEALESDYRSYRNLSEFFSRRLKPDSRPISREPGVVSPADGLILYFGPIQDGRIEGVKGLNYSVQSFLGLPSKDYERELIVDKENNELYNCIIYLAPGDYHRFHSPAEWLVNHRKHFPGRLLSVRPSLMKRLPEVLHINERVCYFGNWAHGFFSMTAVGATNVGSIKVNFDEDLRTNRRHLWRPDKFSCFEHKFDHNISLQTGQDFGEFNFGSTIVLIFEAPKGSTFNMKANQRIKYGQLVARIEPPPPPSASATN